MSENTESLLRYLRNKMAICYECDTQERGDYDY